jgi:DNA-binding MarR family transcriptional regulator
MDDLDRFAGPNEPLALLHFAFRSVIAGPDKELEKRGLHRMHHRILFFVARAPGISVGELLATLGITKQTLHGPMQALTEAGMIRAEPDAKDGRMKRLHLTRSGAAFEEKLSGAQRRMFEAAFAAAGPEAARGWRKVMRTLAEQL